jgi:hypothetical protein
MKGAAMASPLIYVGTHAVAPGKDEAAKEASRDMARFVEANHERILHFEIFLSDEGREMTVIHVHPDESSLALHLQLAAEKIAGAYDFLERTTSIHIFGDPSDGFTEQVHAMGRGAPVTVHRDGYGFSRLATVSA